MNKSVAIIITITILLLGATIYFFTLPTWSNYQSTKEQVTQKEKELSEVRSKLKSYQTLNSRQDEIKKYAEKTSNLVPQTPALENFLIDLEALIAQSPIPTAEFHLATLSSKSKTANNPSVIQGLKNYQLTITGQGTLAQIIEFVNKIKTMNRLTEITAIDLNSAKDVAAIDFSLTGNIFSASETSTASANGVLNPDEILSQAVEKITEFQTYGQAIEIQTEDGIGRANPFLAY